MAVARGPGCSTCRAREVDGPKLHPQCWDDFFLRKFKYMYDGKPQGSETTLRPGYWYNTPVNIDATNVPVRAQIAKASAKDL